MEAASQCLTAGLKHKSCTPFLSTLTLPTPLEPLISSSSPYHHIYGMFTTPLFLFAISLFIVTLLTTHALSRTPIRAIGQLGIRGRSHHSWNERVSGDCGRNTFLIDWWIFGGSVWMRVLFTIWDLMAGHHLHEEGEDGGEHHSGGENLYACFGVAREKNENVPSSSETKVEGEVKETDKQSSRSAVGILGYDSSLGAHGPLIMAPLRASMLIFGWCSVCTFLIMTHKELVVWMTDISMPSDPYVEKCLPVALCIVHGIQWVMNAGELLLQDIHINTADPYLEIIAPTAIYATSFVTLLEISLYILGKVCTILKIYVPQGVSHPGGARAHKIVRVPQWTKGKEHYLPNKKMISQLRCAVAHDAHRDTYAKFNAHAGDKSSSNLTGEPFGRQIWTTLKSQPPSAGQGKTEDELEATLKKEFLAKSNTTTVNNRSNKQPAAVDAKPTLKKEDSNIFSDFVQNLFSPEKERRASAGQTNQGSGDTKKSQLVQTLASGGRTPLAFDPSKNPNSCDQLFRAQMIESYLEKNDGKLPEDISYLQTSEGQKNNNNSNNPPKTVMEAAKRGVSFYSMLQSTDGHWAGDYGGPHFLMPGLIMAWYVMGRPAVMISPGHQVLMLHYLKAHQQEDGGWGTHIESPSTMFGTVICYLAVRLLGAKEDEDWIVKGREFIQKEGGAVMTSSWAKFWLCLVGCMDWKGHNSVPPEMWLLPNWFPFHPGRMWCHCRMVYLPMGYLYGSRFIYKDAETDPLIADLRKELYCEPYDSIDWDSTRNLVAPMDNYSPIPAFMSFAQNCLAFYENWNIFSPFRNAVRKAGLKFCSEYMKAEDLQTNYIDIGPVNKALNMVSAYHAANCDINDTAVRSHMMRVPDYLWVAEDGMKMQGYNGSQCWDTSFAIQAVWECGLLDKFPVLSTKVWAYLERTQILSTSTSKSSPAYKYESCDSRDKFYRHVSKGGWPFSTSAHGWPISDCTGEGLKGVLALMDSPVVMGAVKRGVIKSIEPSRLYDAVNVILTLQNEDGGWATYENNRGFGWYEQLNPSEVFGDIMIDYSYVECSMASLTALAEFHEKFPHHRTNEIMFAIRRGAEFMKSIQREDGSWYGSWACCFCYGCWFGIEGLIKAGESHTSSAIQKCCQFLLSQQRPNGGWGEDFTSCYDKDYAANGMKSYGDDGSGVVNTAWALMALSEAKCSDVDAIRRGVQYLMKRQLDCGDWPQEGISGVFNRACGITYTAYRNVFPIWALGRCAATYGSVLDEDTS